MKRFLFIFFLLLLLLPHYSVRGHAQDEHDSLIVHMTKNGFKPDDLEVFVGDTVVFKNDDGEDHWPASNAHPTHALYSEFDPRKPVGPQASWSFTFEKSGQWKMHDHLFPHMTGVITVVPHDSVTKKTTIFPRVWENVKAFFSWLFPKKSALKNAVVPKGENATGNASNPTTFVAPQPHDTDDVYSNFEFTCTRSDYGCASNALKSLTREYGPETALGMLRVLMNDGRVSGESIDDHQLAHEVGREVSRAYGVNSEAFLLCPMSSFNGGCQHGFFEYVLGKTNTTAEAADLICASLGDDFSKKFRFYCYHGVGHGVMMAQAYDLHTSLSICDSFEGGFAQDGCWQGVFMENSNAQGGGYAREGVFSKEDPLAPCNTLDEKYRHECYINHAGHLVGFFGHDVRKATTACLNAKARWIPACLQSIGLMATNPVWQGTLLRGAETMEHAAAAWEICKRFPDGKERECVIAGVNNITNFDGFNTSRAQAFCETVDTEHRTLCFRTIGGDLRNQATDENSIRDQCSLFGREMHSACLGGAGL
jgi:plastocyanin